MENETNEIKEERAYKALESFIKNMTTLQFAKVVKDAVDAKVRWLDWKENSKIFLKTLYTKRKF